MAVQTVFQRYEMKYLLTQAQREAVLRALEPHMALDPTAAPSSATSTWTRRATA